MTLSDDVHQGHELLQLGWKTTKLGKLGVYH